MAKSSHCSCELHVGRNAHFGYFDMKYESNYDLDFVHRNNLVAAIDYNYFNHILKKIISSKTEIYTKKDKIKNIYDRIYTLSENELYNKIDKLNSYQIIIEAMSQLELWTHFYHDGNVLITSNPDEMIPIYQHSRYIWQYLIEILISKYIRNKDRKLKTIHFQDLKHIFTLLFLMSHSSSISNEIHYFPEKFLKVKLTYEKIQNLTSYEIVENNVERFRREYDYAMEKPDFEKFPTFSPSMQNSKLKKIINEKLFSNFDFNYIDIENIINAVMEMNDQPVMIVDSYSEFTSNLSLDTNYRNNITDKILRFLSYNYKSIIDYRNFLDRSQTYRMINFASVILPKCSKLQSIFGIYSSRRKEIIHSKEYIIFSPLLAADWVDRFVYRLINGKVSYLNSNKMINQATSEIEDYFHKDIIEKEFESELIKRNFYTIRSLKKYKKNILPCGEIDVLAFSEKNKILYFFELKGFAGIIDPKSKKQLYENYFGKKNYHKKIIDKINWVNDNRHLVIELFNSRHNLSISDIKTQKSYNITYSSNYLKFQINEYKIFRFDEFLNDFDKNGHCV